MRRLSTNVLSFIHTFSLSLFLSFLCWWSSSLYAWCPCFETYFFLTFFTLKPVFIRALPVSRLCVLLCILGDPGAVSRVERKGTTTRDDAPFLSTRLTAPGSPRMVRVGTQALFRPYLKTFVAPFLSTRLTAPGSPRMTLV